MADKGVQLMNLIKGFDRSERIVAMFSVKEFTEDLFIQFIQAKVK